MIKINKTTVILILLLVSTMNLSAQPGVGISYAFSTTAGAPTAFPAGTNQAVPAPNQDDFGYLFAPVGMSLKFGGNTYTKFVASTNGWMALVPASVVAIPGSLSGGGYLNTNGLSTYAGGYPIIAPYWDDLAATLISYNWTAGALWVRWTAKIDKTNATPANNFWVKIDGTTGVITMYYSNAAYTISGIPSASIGIAGVCTGDYYSYNLPAAPAYADSTIETSTIATRPVGFTYTFTPRQTNDNCAGAIDLGPLSGTCTPAMYNISFATTSGSAVTCSPGGTDVGDVWFKVTKPAGPANVTITTSSASPACQSIAGTSIEVFASCGGVSLGCATTSGTNPGFGEVVVTRPCAPEVLYVRVTADGDIGGKFNICASSAAAAAGTGANCTAAVSLCAPLPFTSLGLTTAGSVNDYNDSLLCQSDYLTGQDYVFTYTPTVTECINISIDGTGANSFPGLFLLDGCPNDTDNSVCVASATNTSNGDTIFNISVFAGHTYYIVVDNNSLLAGANSIPFNIRITNSVTAAPPNDGCAGAASLGNIGSAAVCVWSAPFTTQCATPSPIAGYPNPGCGGFNSQTTNDVWFSFNATFSGIIQINSQGTGANPVIHGGFAVYSGTCGSFTLVGCAGDSVSIPYNASTAINVTPQTYYIRYWSATGYDPGSFQLCFQANCAPPNDLPVNSITLPLATPMLGDNTCSTGASEMATPVNCTTAPINTVWFKITVPPSGQVAVRISQLSLLDAAVAAFTIPNLAAINTFTRLACNDDIIFAPPCPICGMTGDNDAAIQFSATPGSTVYLAVDGEGGQVGTFYITAIEGTLASQFPPVFRKDCLNPENLCSNANYLVPNGGIGSDGNICDFTNLACSGGVSTSEVGSTWVTFTVSAGSTLGFTITPNDSAAPIANYNFYLWDVTGIPNPCSQLGTLGTVRCNTAAGTGKTGCRNPTTAVYSNTIAPFAVPHNYLMMVENLTAAGDDEGVPGTNTGFVLNWDIYTGGVNVGTTALAGTSSICNWIGTVVDTNYLNIANWKGFGSCPAPIPSCTTDVNISAATKQCWVIGNCYARNLTINLGGTLVLRPGSTLHICGDYTNNGSLIAQAGSTIIFEGTVIQNITGNLTGANAFSNLIINKGNSTQVILNGNLDVNESFTTANATSVFNINGKYLKVGNHFTNASGITTFTGIAFSTVEFNGTLNSNFTNQAGSIVLNRVIMNKPSGKLYLTGVNSSMNIDTALTLTSGIIVTRSLPNLEVNMKYYLPASITGHSSLSYINGKLRRKISNGVFSSPPIPASYDFPLGDSLVPNVNPVGNNGYELGNITFTSATLVFDLTGIFNRWPAGPPAAGPVASECFIANYATWPMFDNGYWTFKRSTTTISGNYRVSLFNTGYTNNSGLGWTVAKADTLPSTNISLSTSWRLLGNCVITSTPGNVQRTNFNPTPVQDSTSFDHHYATAQSDFTLPIELLYFTAEHKGEAVECKWETASETNNDYFEVERSENGIEYEFLDRVKGFGQGSSTESRSYIYDDRDICNSIRYYRLKQVDIDGMFTYSDPVAINCFTSKNEIVVYPNPGKSSITCSFYEVADGIVKLQWLDVIGKIVKEEDHRVVKGYNTIHTDVSEINQGIYYLRVKENGKNPDATDRMVKFLKD